VCTDIVPGLAWHGFVFVVGGLLILLVMLREWFTAKSEHSRRAGDGVIWGNGGGKGSTYGAVSSQDHNGGGGGGGDGGGGGGGGDVDSRRAASDQSGALVPDTVKTAPTTLTIALGRKTTAPDSDSEYYTPAAEAVPAPEEEVAKFKGRKWGRK